MTAFSCRVAALACVLPLAAASAQVNVAILQSDLGLQVDEAANGLFSTSGGPDLPGFQVRRFDVLPDLAERSGRLSFDTSTLPLDRFDVVGVELDFTVTSFTSTGTGSTPNSGVDVSGFSLDDSPFVILGSDPGATLLASTAADELGRFSLDLGAAAAALVAEGDGFGVAFRGQGDTNVSIAGPGAIPFGDRPVLAVSLQEIPEPATGLLAAAGLACLGRRRARVAG
ncbi:PEP-CTERM sorting domain-containing protein [Phycisphaera mikurensis]|nr:PEP-CTERM sorting domain-containing protein [Phycisphaera mikurensis]MBB6441141.1 hypothetical protein [Phycisphaera mikurensis]